MMKIIKSILMLLALLSPLSAKVKSSVKISKVQQVTVSDDLIIIVGNGKLTSRMITTEDNKDSDFILQGKPSAEYTALGYKVKFVIKPYKFSKENFPNLTDAKWEELKKSYKDRWNTSLEVARSLKEGDKVNFFIQSNNVVLSKGYLVEVQGTGSLTKK